MFPSLLLLVAIPLQAERGGDSIHASARVRELVELAAAAHARPPDGLTSFTSDMESEIGILIRGAEGEEVATQVEQVAGHIAWRRDGSLTQVVSGYRARLLGLTLSTLSFMKVPWVVAPLYGDRVPLIFAPDSVDEAGGGAAPPGTGERQAPGREAPKDVPKRLVHPFASDRADFYRFSGGDTVLSLRLPERTVPLVRVTVEPWRVPPDAMVFQGEIDLDAVRHEIVRVRGQLLGRPRRASLLTRLLDATMEGYFLLDLENAEWEGSVWLPHRQRIEMEVKPSFSEDLVILRLMTSFTGTQVNTLVPDEVPATSLRRPPRALVIAQADTLREFRDWRRELGAATAEGDARDFDDVAPDALRSGGPPRLRVGTGGLSDALHYDRVEGLFTGLGARVDFRDALPGGFVGLHGGYAWSEATVRGGAEVGVRRGAWGARVVAERQLPSTNDFPRAFDARPTVLGAFGEDDFDYVDRSSVEARVALSRRNVGTLEMNVGAAEDRAPVAHVGTAPLGGTFRPLRPVDEGSYGHLRLRALLGGSSGGEYLAPGLRAGVTLDLARGDLDWRRLEGFVRARRQRDGWTLAGELSGGVVFADSPPPQTLFELGSYSGRLPGFEYKAFSGDRAAVASVQTMYALPLLEAPVRLGRLFLPAVAPSASVELHAGWAGSSVRTAGLLERLGWDDSEGVRATLFVGIRVFGGSMSLGVARPLGEPGRWRFAWGMEPGD